MSEITQLLEQARCGDHTAWDSVIHLMYADLKRIARSASPRGRQQDVTALVHDCYLRLSKSGAEKIASRAHFLSIAALAMRQIIINHARDSVADKRCIGMIQTTLTGALQHVALSTAYSEAEELLEIDIALNELARQDERLVRVVECRLFAGLNEEETATALNVSLRTSQRLWHDAREKLKELLTSTE